MSEICWRSGIPIEATISEPVVDRVPRSERYSVLQCCGAAIGKGKGGENEELRIKNEEVRRLEAEGEMSNDK